MKYFFTWLYLFVFLGLMAPAQASFTTLSGDFKAAVLSGTRIVALDSDSDLFTSDDGGGSFVLRQATSDTFEAMDAVEGTVIVVGVDGLVLRSIDNGATWSLLGSESSPSVFNALYSVAGRSVEGNPNEWIAVGDDGFDSVVYRSIDDGATWTEVEVLTDVLIRDVIWTGNRWLLSGRDFFDDGIIYSSTDGLTWSAASVPSGSTPLLAMAHDGQGVIVAVGEFGEVLRSVDDGLTFTDAPNIPYFGDFSTVAVDGNGIFYLGGTEKVVLRLEGTASSFLVSPDVQAPVISDLLLINDAVVGVGDFGTLTNRTIPLNLLISVGGIQDYRLTVSQTLSNKVYSLETSIDLVVWLPSGELPRLGTGVELFFDVANEDTKRFWRVVEQ